jgi:hypothetical protein
MARKEFATEPADHAIADAELGDGVLPLKSKIAPTAAVAIADAVGHRSLLFCKGGRYDGSTTRRHTSHRFPSRLRRRSVGRAPLPHPRGRKAWAAPRLARWTVGARRGQHRAVRLRRSGARVPPRAPPIRLSGPPSGASYSYRSCCAGRDRPIRRRCSRPAASGSYLQRSASPAIAPVISTRRLLCCRCRPIENRGNRGLETAETSIFTACVGF